MTPIRFIYKVMLSIATASRKVRSRVELPDPLDINERLIAISRPAFCSPLYDLIKHKLNFIDRAQ